MGLVLWNQSVQKQREAFSSEQTAAEGVNELFTQIYFDVKDLGRLAQSAQIQNRSLLFEYELGNDQKSATIQERLPRTSTRFDSFYDFLNTYAVFLSDPQNTGGLKTTFNLNQFSWNENPSTNYPAVEYNLKPACIRYQMTHSTSDPNPDKIFSLYRLESPACTFDWAEIQKIEATITTVLGPQQVTCTGQFQNAGTCKTQSASDCNLQNEIFAELRYEHATTPFQVGACISRSQMDAGNRIEITPQGGTAPFLFSLGLETDNPTNVVRWNASSSSSGTTFLVSAKLSFSRRIQSFELNGFDFSVQNTAFGINRST